jgi:hypothetical protein
MPMMICSQSVRLDPTITAIAALERTQRLVKLMAIEIGPEDLRKVNFGIGHLPQQKIAQAHLATGANQQVGIASPKFIDMLAK